MPHGSIDFNWNIFRKFTGMLKPFIFHLYRIKLRKCLLKENEEQKTTTTTTEMYRSLLIFESICCNRLAHR